jgi:hypothetical protein
VPVTPAGISVAILVGALVIALATSLAGILIVVLPSILSIILLIAFSRFVTIAGATTTATTALFAVVLTTFFSTWLIAVLGGFRAPILSDLSALRLFISRLAVLLLRLTAIALLVGLFVLAVFAVAIQFCDCALCRDRARRHPEMVLRAAVSWVVRCHHQRTIA